MKTKLEEYLANPNKKTAIAALIELIQLDYECSIEYSKRNGGSQVGDPNLLRQVRIDIATQKYAHINDTKNIKIETNIDNLYANILTIESPENLDQLGEECTKYFAAFSKLLGIIRSEVFKVTSPSFKLPENLNFFNVQNIKCISTAFLLENRQNASDTNIVEATHTALQILIDTDTGKVPKPLIEKANAIIDTLEEKLLANQDKYEAIESSQPNLFIGEYKDFSQPTKAKKGFFPFQTSPPSISFTKKKSPQGQQNSKQEAKPFFTDRDHNATIDRKRSSTFSQQNN